MYIHNALTFSLHVLAGHEHPFAIQSFHNRHQVDYLGDGKPVQLQLVIKRKIMREFVVNIIT